MSEDQRSDYIQDIELPDVEVKWNWSNFPGRANDYDSEGDHHFTMVLPKQTALDLLDAGWTSIKENEPREEEDEPEWTFKAKLSYRFEGPKVFFLKGKRRMRAEERDLSDITRATATRIDVVLTPSRWVNGNRTGVTAYVKEMYVHMTESTFSQMYDEYEEI